MSPFEPFFIRLRNYYRMHRGLGLSRWQSFKVAWRTAWLEGG